MEEKEVKNEVPAPETDRKKEEKTKKELTPQQIQQRKKMLVYPLMGLVFLGSMYLIFAPSDKDEAKVESVGGFNADIPQPKGDGIISDKKTAYEQEQIENKQADKMRSLQDFAFSLGEENGEDLTLIDDAPAEKPKTNVIDFGAGAPNNSRSSIQSSAAAYRDMNRQLGSFYETPKEDKEKEELKRQVEELTARLDAKENGAGSMDEQVALMEKSYELAAKYMNGQNGQSVPPQPGQIVQVAPSAPIQGKGNAIPVKSVSDRTVSGLQQLMSNAEFIAEYGKPRNYGFNTAVGSGYSMGKNTIRACVHNDQTLMDGQTVKLRLLEPLQAGNVIVPKNSLVSGSAKVQGERLDILVSSLEYAGNIIPVELAVYDSDGQKGLSVPSSLEQEAAKEAMANIGAGLGTSISFAQSAGQQVAMDITRGLMQGGSQYLAKKFRTVKVHLKANYQVMLYAKRKYSINSLVYWVTYVHNVVYSFYRSMIYCYINSTQRCAGSIVIDIIPTNGADKRKFFPFAPYFPVTNVIKRYFYPYFPAIIGIKGYSFPYFPYLSGIMKIKTALYFLFSRLDWHKTVVFPCLGEIYEGIRSLSWEIPVT